MNLESCFICNLPVLELNGQFEKLDTYLLNEDDAAYQQNAFGWCHTSCLSKSNWGQFWTERRVWHLTKVKGFSQVYSGTCLSVMQNPRTDERIALRSDGVSFNIKPSLLGHRKDYSGGILLPVFEEINLELDEPTLIHDIRDALVRVKYFPLQQLIEALKLNDYLLYPQAVIDGSLRFDKALKREWVDNWVSANVSYSQFIPQEILDLALIS
jgi:hypothetical protein